MSNTTPPDRVRMARRLLKSGGMRARSGPLFFASLLLLACGETAEDSTVLIASIDPPRGPLAGGNTVTIEGTGIAQGDVEVRVGGSAASSVLVLEDGSVVVTIPQGAQPDAVDVVVASDEGVAYLANGYTYNPVPSISSVVPDRGSHLGASLSVTGTGFEDFDPGVTTVLIGGEPCGDVSIQSDTVIVCNAPQATPWSLADVSIENTNGGATAEGAFGYMKDGLFAIEGRGGIAGTLYFVDTEDGTFRSIASVGTAITGLVSHLDGTLYAVTSNAIALEAGFPRDLVTIDPFTGAASTIGPLLKSDGGAVKIPDIALEYDGDTLYGWSKTDGQLATIDMESAEVSLIGGTASVKGGGLAFDLEGSLYMTPDGSDGELFTCSTTTGALASSADLVDAEGDDINSMSFAVDTMYGIREGVSQDGASSATILLKLDVQTGVVSKVHDLPFGADALAHTPPLPFQ